MPDTIIHYLLLGPFASGALRRALSDAIAVVAPSVFRVRLRAVFTTNVSEKLSGLSVPVMYMRASDDRVVPRHASELISRLNPRTRVVEIEAPHCLLQTAPAEAARVVSAFVEAVGAARYPRC